MAPAVAIRPQPGPQTVFLSSPADIAIYGGAAGGGKTWALLLEPLRHRNTRGFTAAIFRRNLVQVTNPGGLWDASGILYAPQRGKPKLNPLEWSFPGGALIRFAHLDAETTVYDWQGTELCLLCFDELTHFTRSQFFYMLSRNRSTCGVRPYVRATTNPDADSWVADFVAWWIGPDGLPIPERGGRLRWFVRHHDNLVWADSAGELREMFPDLRPKSLTFIPASLRDNAALMAADPGYLANLMALPTVDRERLLGGNWRIRPAAGLYFKRSWCEVVDAAPSDLKIVRYWDLAATAKTESNDPDWTIGVKMGRDESGTYWVLHVERLRADPGEVERAIKITASADGSKVTIGLPQDPGQAGKAYLAYLIRQLDGYLVKGAPESGDKVTRFGPFSCQARGGNVRILRAPWNDIFLAALEGFPEARHDDDADAVAGAWRMFQATNDGLIDYYARLVREMNEAKAGGSAP